MDVINEDLILGLSEVSQSFGSHAKWAKRLLDSFEGSPKQFMKCLLPQLNRIVIVYKRQAAVERLIRFISRLAVEPTKEPSLNGRMAVVVIQYLLQYQNSKNKAVRFRVCQTIGNILNKMNDDYELPEELFDKIQDSMLERIKDKVAVVRAMACACLSRLQDPTTPDDPVVTALLFALDHDTSSAVRKAALVNLGISKSTLPHILLRTKDIASEVRIAAFNVCTEKVAMKALSILQRSIVLYSGIMDRDASVKKACQDTLLPVWLKQCDGSIIKLLSSLDVQEFEKECETITAFCIGPDFQPPLDINFQFNSDQNLTPEDAFFWRIYCESLRKQKRYDMIENIFPVAVEFTQILANYQDNVFVSSQLIRIAGMIDLDEVGRTALTNVLLSWMKSEQTDISLIKSIINTLHRIMVRKQNSAEGESEFITNSLLILADLRDPLEDLSPGDNEEDEAAIIRLEDRYSELAKDLETAKEQYAALRRKKHHEAGEKKSEIALIEQEMEQIDSELASKESMLEMKWLRLTTVTSELLERVRQTHFSSLADLLHSTILPALKHISPNIREEAIRCLCLFMLLDLETARSDSTMFVQAIRNDETPVQVAAIKACFDVLLVHNLYNDPSMTELCDCLFECLSSEEATVRTAVGQGFAKLFANGRITDVKLLSKLILYLFDPLTAKDFELRQTLSVFFPLFSQVNVLYRKLLIEAWCAVLKDFCSAPKSSSVRKIPSQQIAPFLLYLVNNEEADFSQLLLLMLALWCNKVGDTTVDKFFSHSISIMPLRTVQPDNAHVILYLAKRLGHDLTDKTAIRNIAKIVSAIESAGNSLPSDFDDALVDAVYQRFSIIREHPISEVEDSDDVFESPEVIPRKSRRRPAPAQVSDDESDPIQPIHSDPPSQSEENEVCSPSTNVIDETESLTAKAHFKSKDDDSIISNHSGTKRRYRSPSTDSIRSNRLLGVHRDSVDVDKENIGKVTDQDSVKDGSRTRTSRRSKSQTVQLPKSPPKRRRKLRLSDDSRDSFSTTSKSVKPRTRNAQSRSESESMKKMRC